MYCFFFMEVDDFMSFLCSLIILLCHWLESQADADVNSISFLHIPQVPFGWIMCAVKVQKGLWKNASQMDGGSMTANTQRTWGWCVVLRGGLTKCILEYLEEDTPLPLEQIFQPLTGGKTFTPMQGLHLHGMATHTHKTSRDNSFPDSSYILR